MKIDRILRSRRKTLALIVHRDGSLEVRAPLRLSQAAIQTFVERKTAWIARQRARLAESQTPPLRIGYTNGSRLWFLGQMLTLEFCSESRAIHADGQRLIVPARLQSRIESAIETWFRAEARRVITQRAEHYARANGLRFGGIRINNARTRWGSCGAANRLNFPFRLVMAPPEVIDYVVVHELVHTVERNHSRSFWTRVEAVLPDYRRLRRWLKLNGRWLDLAYEADPERIQAVSVLTPSRKRRVSMV